MVARAVWMRRAPGLIRRRAGKMHRRNLAELRRFAHGSIGSPFRSDALGGSRVFQSIDRLDDVAKLVRQFIEAVCWSTAAKSAISRCARSAPVECRVPWALIEGREWVSV